MYMCCLSSESDTQCDKDLPSNKFETRHDD